MLFPSLKFQRINTYNHHFPSFRLTSVVLSGSSSLYQVIFLLLCSQNPAFFFDCSYLNHWFFYFLFCQTGGGTVSRFQKTDTNSSSCSCSGTKRAKPRQTEQSSLGRKVKFPAQIILRICKPSRRFVSVSNLHRSLINRSNK